MNRALLTVVMVLGTAAFVFGLQTANAEFIGPTKDSENFSWKYEMDVGPSTQDLDQATNPGNDWGLYGGTPTLSGGYMTLVSDGATPNPRYTTHTSFGATAGHIWKNITGATGFTFEISVKPVDAGNHGSLYILIGDGSTGDTKGSLGIGEDRLWWNVWADKVILNEEDNSGDYHVFRIAQAANDTKFYIWRDGELVGDGLTSTAATYSLVGFGDYSPDAEGPAVVDYVRITAGGYAPIPEPTSAALLTTGLIGLLAYAWRKRK